MRVVACDILNELLIQVFSLESLTFLFNSTQTLGMQSYLLYLEATNTVIFLLFSFLYLSKATLFFRNYNSRKECTVLGRNLFTKLCSAKK